MEGCLKDKHPDFRENPAIYRNWKIELVEYIKRISKSFYEKVGLFDFTFILKAHRSLRS